MRQISYFPSVKAAQGGLLTYDEFLEMTMKNDNVRDTCAQIARCSDPEERGRLKKKLPIITWQASFPGKRLAKDAVPSGLYMLDIDHVEEPYTLYEQKIAAWVKEYNILLVHMTPSQHGLRIVAKCRKDMHTLEECQRWLAQHLGVEYDSVCKDWARSSFVVPMAYVYFMNGKELWTNDAEPDEIYETNCPAPGAPIDHTVGDSTDTAKQEIDQREGLFGGQTEYRGLKLEDIANAWLEATGGQPNEGERNVRLFHLATRMRYITDFNEATIKKCIPHCGLRDEEIISLVHSAVTSTRASAMPRDLKEVIQKMQRARQFGADDINVEEIEKYTDTSKIPPLPPVIRQVAAMAPDDFKQAVVLCQLPILGALGSKLRAKYLDGQMHSPSFQVSLEAPQASGKSFMSKLVKMELAQMLEHDEEERQREREYDAKVRELKLLNIKVNADNKNEVLGDRPKTMIRYVPATISVTKLLQRMDAAKGLHLFAMAEEVDTVTKTFKRGFSSYSDLLRVSFDNGLYGQDYASENSFSGIVPIYYNLLTSGTPKAMRRFYPDVEDGLVSRVCFVTLPDQFGKKMPTWSELKDKDKDIVDIGLVRLNDISVQGNEVQPEHIMKLDWLNMAMQEWITKQQAFAVKNNDRTRDIFCRRAAVVGFRAGMLAWFLYNEKRTPTICRQTTAFAIWVANCMLNQHLLRFNITETGSNVNRWAEVYEALGDVFTREELEEELEKQDIKSGAKTVLYKWSLLGSIEKLEDEKGNKGQKTGYLYKKTKK